MYDSGDAPVRICIVGARAEAMLPLRNWAELAVLCPDTVWCARPLFLDATKGLTWG